MFYNETNRDGDVTLALFFVDDVSAKSIPGTHPYYERIRSYLADTPAAEHDEAYVLRLVDPTIGIGEKMAAISDRVSFTDRTLTFDGKPLNNVISKHIVDKIHAGDDQWERVVRFMLNLDENPSHRAQEATYKWVEANGLTITEEGHFLGYKAVTDTPEFLSSSSGPDNWVNGSLYNGGASCQVPHEVGSVISKKRADVDDTPGGGCSVGLHVGTYDYASTFEAILMTVKINPRDVVSVPDSNMSFKIRVCRYEVISINENKEAFIGTEETTSYDTYREIPTLDEDDEETATGEWKVVEQDSYFGITVMEIFHSKDAAFEALEGWNEGDEGEEGHDYYVMDPTGTLGLFPADFEEISAEEEAVILDALAAVILDALAESVTTESDADEEADFLYDSLAEAEESKDRAVLKILRDKSVGHKPAARTLVESALVITTESSVRRWRKAHGVVLG